MALSLDNNSIHLWLAYPDEIQDEALLLRYADLLTDAEKIRWQRFYFPQHRHQFLVTRALLRATLSLYADVEPKDWCFDLNRYGKPEIAQTQTDLPIRFNLSHTDGVILCGIVLEHDLGVDIENQQKERASLNIAEHFFSRQEIASLQKISGQQQKQQRFFEYWTLKEAYIKARGMGLSLPLDQFSFVLEENRPVQIAFDPSMQENPNHWQFWQLYPSEQHIAAVAIKSGSPDFQLLTNKVIPLQNHPSLPASSTHSQTTL
jgi:4'-phosphopantetheinyl transferase